MQHSDGDATMSLLNMTTNDTMALMNMTDPSNHSNMTMDDTMNHTGTNTNMTDTDTHDHRMDPGTTTTVVQGSNSNQEPFCIDGMQSTYYLLGTGGSKNGMVMYMDGTFLSW
jgi:hypothetical protein